MIHQKQITRYCMRTTDGQHATIALDIGADSVTFMADSSFGPFCHRWNGTGGNPVAFLRGLRYDDVMQQLRGDASRIFDREAQEKVLQARTIALRLQDKLDAEHARWCFDEVGHVCDARSLDQFWANLFHSDLSLHLFNNCIAGFSAETRAHPHCVDFWDLMWVPLMAQLAREAAPATARAMVAA